MRKFNVFLDWYLEYALSSASKLSRELLIARHQHVEIWIFKIFTNLLSGWLRLCLWFFRGKYGNWTQEELERAIVSYRNGEAGLYATSHKYYIPKATLKRHLDNKNKIANWSTKRFRRPCTLPQEFEELLVRHILDLENMMVGMSKRDLMAMAYQLAESNGLKHPFNSDKKSASTHWYRDFIEGHTEVSLRQAEATSVGRAKGFNRKHVNEFYDKQQTLIDMHGFDGTRMFNMDESGITTVQKHCKVFGKKGKKQIGSLTSGETGVNTTVVCCMSAGGNFVPPMVIFKRKRMIESLRMVPHREVS